MPGIGFGIDNAARGFALSPRTAKRLAILDRLRAAAASAQASNAEDLPAMASPPTIATSAAATGALTSLYSFANHPEVFRVSNGIPTARTDGPGVADGLWVFPNVKIENGVSNAGNLGSWTGDTADQQSNWSLAFDTDADVVEFKLLRNTTAGRGYAFLVDGQYVSLALTDLSALTGTVSYVKLTFADRRVRTITVEAQASNQMQFAQVAVGPTAQVSYPRARIETLAIFAGDSFTEGYTGLAAPARAVGWPFRAQKRLGITCLFNLAIGGTGYVAKGVAGASRDQVGQIVNHWSRAGIPTAPDLVVFAGGYNDTANASSSQSARDTIKAKATAAWVTARALYPDALFVVMGGFGGRNNANADYVAMEGCIRDAFAAWADDFALFIPVNVNMSGTLTNFVPYQTGTGKIGATTGSGNNDVASSNDGTHPSDYGHDYISQRFVADFVTRLSALALPRVV